MKSFREDENIALEGTVSQIFDVVPSLYFILKNGKLLLHFQNFLF